MEVLGIDVGFGFTKAINQKKSVIFKSLIGESTDIQFKANIGENSYASNLHVSIGDRSFFIGNFAEQQSNVRQYTLDQDKLMTEFLRTLALTATGICCDDTVSINVVSGLPVGYLKQDYKRFTEIISGHHNVVFHRPDGEDVTKSIYIHKVQMMPQPVGSIFNLLMDEKGNIINKDLSTQKVGVVDIGFRTTDFTIFDNLHYIERGSVTMDTGISKSFNIIANKLRQESGVTIELYRLYKAVETGYIKIKGKEFNISNLRDRVYSHSASALAGDINRLWADEWDIDAIILTGGGSVELSKHLEPLIEGNVIPSDKAMDARLNNVRGYHKFGQYKWGSDLNEAIQTDQEAEEKKKPLEKKVDKMTAQEKKKPENGKSNGNGNGNAQKGLKWLKK